jgi:hypothetical protein
MDIVILNYFESNKNSYHTIPHAVRSCVYHFVIRRPEQQYQMTQSQHDRICSNLGASHRTSWSQTNVQHMPAWLRPYMQLVLFCSLALAVRETRTTPD